MRSRIQECIAQRNRRSDLATRDGRLEQLRRDLYRQQAPDRTPEALAQRDAAATAAEFARLGWGSEEGDARDARLNALLRRVQALKAAWAAAAGAAPPAFNWDAPPWR